MALTKRNYVSGETVITATNLNDIQDAIIVLEGKGLTKEEVVDALEYTPAKASDIPTTDISANTAARHSHSNKDVLDNITEITSISGGAVTGGNNALVTKEVLDATSQHVIIIEGGMNDGPDSDIKVNSYYEQFLVSKSAYYKKNSSSTATQTTVYVKPSLDTIDRTCFAGAYRYICEELLTLFPSAQIFLTTASHMNYFENDPNQAYGKIAE